MTGEIAIQYSWSINGETYHDRCNSPAEAIAAAVAFHGAAVEAGTTLHIGEVAEVTVEEIINAEDVVEQLQVQACDIVGEAAEDYLGGVTDQELAELEALIAAWANRVETPYFWQVVNVTQHTLTAADCARVVSYG